MVILQKEHASLPHAYLNMEQCGCAVFQGTATREIFQLVHRPTCHFLHHGRALQVWQDC